MVGACVVTGPESSQARAEQLPHGADGALVSGPVWSVVIRSLFPSLLMRWRFSVGPRLGLTVVPTPFPTAGLRRWSEAWWLQTVGSLPAGRNGAEALGVVVGIRALAG